MGFVCEEPLCSLGIVGPGAECAVCGRVMVPVHAAWAPDPVSGGVDRPGGGFCHSCPRANPGAGGESASSHLGVGPPLRAHTRQRVQPQIWFPSSSNRQQGWGKLSGILIVLLHVAELHECGGRREQPEAMWGMRG